MIKKVLLLFLGALMPVGPAAAQSIPGCGGVNLRTDIWQAPDFQQYVNAYTQTTRNIDLCVVKIRVEGWVDGITMNTAIAESWGTAVTVNYGTPVPNYASRTAVGKHWAIMSPVGWIWLGQSSNTTGLQAPADDPRPADDPGLASGDPSCDGCVSPIIIDVGRNGYRLTGVAGGVRFDLDADGIPEQVAWTHQDSDDAFLVMDRNGNGRIDDGTELFGNRTHAYPGNTLLTTANGFDALGFLESPDYGQSHADDRIDARDQVFGKLLLWTDRNHNGISEPDELQALSAAGVTGIATAYEMIGRRDQHGNLFRQKGTVFFTRGQAPCYDVWLRTR